MVNAVEETAAIVAEDVCASHTNNKLDAEICEL